MCRGLFLERRSRVLNTFASIEIQNWLRAAGIGEIYDPFQLWHVIIQILKKIKMAMLWNEEKRNHSAKTSNRCLNSHPNYQDLGTWWGGTVSDLGTPGASWTFGHPFPTLAQEPPTLLPPFGDMQDVQVVVRRTGGAESCDAKDFSQSCCALSSTNKHRSKSSPGFQELES